ncbi:hypothetical protein [Ruegeria jejuensis]|uniref:hypothetical protein n=1 Tax=Ruegeria jejuensis TaxID=3233338 RepID=UPI00355C55D5
MKLLVGVFVSMMFFLHVVDAQAQDSQSFVGTWTGETTILLDTGKKIIEAPRQQSIIITEADGNLLRGYRTWSALEEDQQGFVGSVPTSDAQEPFIGVIMSNGTTIRMVETEDGGLMFCELISPDQIEMTYMEAAPHAVIYTTVYKKIE